MYNYIKIKQYSMRTWYLIVIGLCVFQMLFGVLTLP